MLSYARPSIRLSFGLWCGVVTMNTLWTVVWSCHNEHGIVARTLRSAAIFPKVGCARRGNGEQSELVCRAHRSVQYTSWLKSWTEHGQLFEKRLCCDWRESPRRSTTSRYVRSCHFGLGLHEGGAPIPMSFVHGRWSMDKAWGCGRKDCVDVQRTRWEAPGLGIYLLTKALTRTAWAEDAWLFSTSCQSLELMMRELAVAAETEVGLDIRCDKCSVSLIAPHLPHTDG